MKITELLEDYGSEISVSKFADVYKDDLTIALNQYKKNQILYRGVNSFNDIMIVDSRTYTRTSLTGNNTRMLLVDDFLPSWKNYPDRKKSIICSGQSDVANGFGGLYIVLPLGNPNVATSLNDFNYARWSDEFVFDTVSSYFTRFAISEGYPASMTTDEQLKMMEAGIKFYDENYDKLISMYGARDSIMSRFIAAIQPPFIKSIDEALNPTAAGFKLTSLNDLSNSSGNDEIWFSGSAILIRNNKDLLKEVFK